MTDGIYVDASLGPLGMGIGAVLVAGGKVVRRASCLVPEMRKVHNGERFAIRWARRLFPGETVHSDCSASAKQEGAVWVPRGQNAAAHAAAKRASGAKEKSSKRKRRRGGGCSVSPWLDSWSGFNGY